VGIASTGTTGNGADVGNGVEVARAIGSGDVSTGAQGVVANKSWVVSTDGQGFAKANWVGVVSTGGHVRPEKRSKTENNTVLYFKKVGKWVKQGFVRLLKNDEFKVLRGYDEENNAVFS
jgi:DUF1009 family protein